MSFSISGLITMKKTILLGLVILSGSLPVNAQGYHQSYGDSRVVNQSQTGLYTPSSSYLGAGTLSKSATGQNAGIRAGGLPTTVWGGSIRAPGDGLYNGSDGTMRQENGAVIYADQYMARQNQIRRMAEQRMFRQRQQQQQYNAPQGNFYVPGSNGGAAGYGSGGTAGYGSYK